MTTLRQIIVDAFRESGITPVGGTPGADEHSEALRRLQNIIKQLFGNELGEQLRTINYENISNYTNLPTNVRIVFDSEGALTLNLHKNPRDGARLAVIDNGADFATNNITLDGNGRKIELADTVTLNTNSLNREWFYRDDLGNWVRVTDLTANDESPFPAEFDDLLITLLAFRLNPRYGAETHQEMVEVLKDIRRRFRARYRQVHEVSVDDGLIILPSTRSHYGYWFSAEKFDKGL